MANVPPIETRFKTGQSGNPKGKPKGIKSWSTIIRNLLADEALASKIQLDPELKALVESIPNKNGAHLIAIAMITRAIAGDRKAADWLRKTGYGDKLDITSDGKELKQVAIYDMRNGAMLQPVPVPKPKERAPVKRAATKVKAKKAK